MHREEFFLPLLLPSQVQVHQRLYMLRAGNLEGDPIPELAAEMLAAHGGLLCFDEFQVLARHAARAASTQGANWAARRCSAKRGRGR